MTEENKQPETKVETPPNPQDMELVATITEEEKKRFNELSTAKVMIKNRVDMCINEIGRCDILLWELQKETEKKYNVKLNNKDHVLSLSNGEIRKLPPQPEPKIEEPKKEEEAKKE